MEVNKNVIFEEQSSNRIFPLILDVFLDRLDRYIVSFRFYTLQNISKGCLERTTVRIKHVVSYYFWTVYRIEYGKKSHNGSIYMFTVDLHVCMCDQNIDIQEFAY